MTVTFTTEELKHLLDALKKGAARHLSYAKFYGGNRQVQKHEQASRVMRRLHERLNALVNAAS